MEIYFFHYFHSTFLQILLKDPKNYLFQMYRTTMYITAFLFLPEWNIWCHYFLIVVNTHLIHVDLKYYFRKSSSKWKSKQDYKIISKLFVIAHTDACLHISLLSRWKVKLQFPYNRSTSNFIGALYIACLADKCTRTNGKIYFININVFYHGMKCSLINFL